MTYIQYCIHCNIICCALGIGYEVVRQLATTDPSLTVLLGSRSIENGHNAVNQLIKQYSFKNIQSIQLDVTNNLSIKQCTDTIYKKYNRLDVLVNNAGILATKTDEVSKQISSDTIRTNFYGTLHTIVALHSLIQPNARIVNMSSSISWMCYNKLSRSLQSQLSNPHITQTQLCDLLDSFTNQSDNRAELQQSGWYPNAYGISKIGVNILTRILARDNIINGVTYNAVHPGYVKTNMTAHGNPIITPEHGAETVLAAVLQPVDNAVTGQYWQHRRPYKPC